MRPTSWFLTAIGTLALGGIAQAQPLSSPPGGAAMTETMPEASTPAVPQQDRAAATADSKGTERAASRQWLTQAKEAVRRGNLSQASEFLERAATRMLTRSTTPDTAGEPMRDPHLATTTAAREALQRRDRQEALRRIDEALGAG